MLIPTKDNIKTITDMREDALGLLKAAEKMKQPIFLFHRSRPKAVILSMEEFLRIQEMLEDYLENQEARALTKEPKGKLIPFEKIAKKYV